MVVVLVLLAAAAIADASLLQLLVPAILLASRTAAAVLAGLQSVFASACRRDVASGRPSAVVVSCSIVRLSVIATSCPGCW